MLTLLFSCGLLAVCGSFYNKLVNSCLIVRWNKRTRNLVVFSVSATVATMKKNQKSIKTTHPQPLRNYHSKRSKMINIDSSLEPTHIAASNDLSLPLKDQLKKEQNST